jgi:hypothetical protein
MPETDVVVMMRASTGPPQLGLVAPVGGGVTGRREGALQVHLDDGVPFVLAHVDEHAVAQDAGVQHDGVELAERLDRLVDHVLGAIPVGNVVAVGHGLAAHRLDLVHNLLGGAHVVALAGPVAAQVVHDHLGAMLGQHQAMFPADAAGAARHDRNPSLAQSRHWCLPSFACLNPIVLG